MITNKYWKIEKWNYWLDYKKENGIVPEMKATNPPPHLM
jgi:hypothetical protein